VASLLRKYGEATTIEFPLIVYSQSDFSDVVVAFNFGDSRGISITAAGDAIANTNNLPSFGMACMYRLSLVAAEMTCLRLIVLVVDQSTPKLWEDQMICIETYGHPNAMHRFDLDSLQQTGYVVSVSKP